MPRRPSPNGSKAVLEIRPGETNPASDAAREGVQEAIESIVRAFTEAKLAHVDDDPAGGQP